MGMINKPLYIIIFVYSVSFSMLGAQFLADSYGITMVNQDGVPIKSTVIDNIRIENLNTATANIVSNQTSERETEWINNPILAGATIAWELFLLLSGTYIFNIMFQFGIPIIFIVPISAIYIILLANTLIAKIRGV